MVVLNVGDDLVAKLAAGERLFDLIPNQRYTFSDITLPEGTVIRGNQAIINSGSVDKSIFNINSKNVNVSGCNFIGRLPSTNNAAYNKNHFAIKVARGLNVKITKNSFINFLGGGIGLIGSATDNYFNYAALISENLFQNCFIAVLWTGRYEFGHFVNNRIFECRVGIWDEAGNWTMSNNKITACRNPYISTNKAIDFSANNINAFVANSAHGTFTGNECNHANDKGNGIWTVNADIPLVGGQLYNPGVTGIVFDGILPATVNGLTLYYCNVTMRNRATMSNASKLVGVVAASMTFSADKPDTMEIVGLTIHTGVSLVNVLAK